MAQFETIDSRGPGKPWKARNIENQEVNEPGPALAAMLEELCLIDTLLGGTPAMRAAKRDHLPQHEYESNRAYDRRLQQTILDNYTLRTLNTLVGKAFKEPPAPGADMDEALIDFLDDVDGSGTGLIPFARQFFREGVKGAVAYLLVDTPAEGEAPTKADGGRATWRLIPTRDMLDYREGPTPLGTRPVYIRFKDDVVEADGKFGTRLVERRKIITDVDWELWELQTGPRGGSPKWVKTDGGPLKTGYVPVVPFYTDKTGPGEGRSNLADLAWMNRRHWQSTSDQINILTVCRFPILAASGLSEVDGAQSQTEDLTANNAPTAVIGPNKFLSTPDPQGKFYWVEHTGAAVKEGTNELERLEQAMSSYGAEFLKQGAAGPETASGRVLDEGDAISPLQSWGIDFRDALMLALSYTAEAMAMKDANVEIDFEIEPEVSADGQDVTALNAARDRRDISRRAYLEELKLRGIIKNDKFDIDQDQEEIDDEPPPPGTGLDGMAAGLKGAKPPTKKPAA